MIRNRRNRRRFPTPFPMDKDMLKSFFRKNLVTLAGALAFATILFILIFAAPEFLKANYVLFLQLAFFIGIIYLTVRNREDFLVFLFIVSLSFTLFNINILKYFPALGELIPRIMPADILLLLMVILKLKDLSLGQTRMLFPVTGNGAFLLLIGSILFSLLLIAPRHGEYQHYGFYYLYAIFRGYLIFLYFYNYLRDESRYRTVILSFTFVVAMQFGFMCYQWITGDFLRLVNLVYENLDDTRIQLYGETRKAFGTFHYPSIAAGVVLIIFSMVIAYTSRADAKSPLLKICRVTVLILGPVCVLLSGARVALIALFALIPAVLYFMASRYGHREFKRRLVLYLLGTLFLVLLTAAVPPVMEYWQERLSREDFLENSLDFRVLVYKIGMRALGSHPLFGIGSGNGDEYGNELVNGMESELYNFGLHNGYMRFLVENGVAGLAVYLLWYFALIRAASRRRDDLDGVRQFSYLGGLPPIILMQMLLIDTQGVLLLNEAEFMYFCLALGFMRGYDEMARSRDRLLQLSVEAEHPAEARIWTTGGIPERARVYARADYKREVRPGF